MLHYLPYGFLAVWLMYFGTAFENTLKLAAEGRIDFTTAWTYRFRGTDFESGRTVWDGIFLSWLWLIKYSGPRFFWATAVILISSLVPRKSIIWKIFFLVAVTTAVLYSEAALLWILSILVLGRAVLLLRQRRIRVGFIATLGSLVLATITLRWANPAAYLERQRVLGGKSLIDTIEIRPAAHKIRVEENCVAAINADDLRGVSSVEKLDPASLARFERVVLIDLKIVEENYRLLFLKDEKGKPLFSEGARAFAAAEAGYAQKITPILVAARNLCLIANFDTAPQKEQRPFSRARMITDVRAKSGLDTKIIQLPPGDTNR